MRARRLMFVLIGLVLTVSVFHPALAQKGEGDIPPLPAERDAITIDNVDQLVQVSTWPGWDSRLLAWSTDGKTLATATLREGWGIALYDVDNLKTEPRFVATGPSEEMSLSPDGGLIATGHGDGTTGTLSLWSTVNGAEVLRTADLKSMIGGLAFSRDGSLIAVSDLDNAYVYEVKDSALNRVQIESSLRMAKFAFSPDGNLLAAANGWALVLWGLYGYQPDITLQNAGFAATNVAFSPDSARLAGVGSPGPLNKVAIWDLASGAQILADNWFLDRNASNISLNADVSFSADGSLFAASNGSREAYIHDAATGERLATLSSEPPGNMVRLAFSPDGTLIAAIGSPDDDPGRVWLWAVPKR